MTDMVLIVDALSAGEGRRTSSRDSIGCGPRTIAGVFELHSISCRIMRAESFFKQKQSLKKYTHLAISAMSMDKPIVQRVVNTWKKTKNGKIIIGGPISTDTSVLQSIKPNLVVIGEGEVTLDRLLQSNFLDEEIELDEIPGIAYLVDGNVKTTVRREFLDSKTLSEKYIPSAVRVTDYAGFKASKVYVEVLRGCSNFRRTKLKLPDGRVCTDCSNCDSDNLEERINCPEEIPPGCGFCSVPNSWGPPRSREKNVIVKEIEDLLTLGVRRIVLEAPDFLDYQRGEFPLTDPCQPPANTSAIKELLDAILQLPWFQESQAHLSIENIKACLFTEDVAQILSTTLPSTSPNIGLETGSSQHADHIGKCGSPHDVLRAVRLASEHGMSTYVYFIYGLPGETAETVDESIKLMRLVSEQGAERIILYGFRALPGSAFEDFPEPTPDYAFGKKLQEAARSINKKKKQEYIGRILRVVASEPSWAKKGYTMFYPLGEGPLLTVKGSYSSGTVISVRVTRVLSSRLLEAEPIT
jgi:radical SAM superfamily enzyme YgiQ (UPF0313 family)